MKCCDLHAGMLKHSVTIKSKGLTADGIGGGAVTWSTVATCRANVSPISAGEAYRFGQLNATVTHKVLIRYRTGITAAMSVVFGSRYFQIRGIKNIEESSRWLELACEEGVAL